MKLMPSCRKAAELTLKSLDQGLNFVERLRLRMHLKRCAQCPQFGEQLRLMRDVMREDDALD